MNLEEILVPIGEAITWSFETLLVPLGNMPNTIFTILGFVGLAVWLNMQAKYNKKAKQEGSLK
ncbi:MAG: hypothetical protein ACPF8V_10985 [Luteibaculum sp.]